MSKKVTKKEINKHHKLFTGMIKENEEYTKKDIERVLGESDLGDEGDGVVLVAKLVFIMMAEQLFPLTDTYRKEFNKFLNKINLKG